MNLFQKYLLLPNAVTISKNSQLPIASIKYKKSVLDWENPLLMMARGLVIDVNGNVVAKPYNKFFNYKQLDYLKSENRHTLDPDFAKRLNTMKLPSDAFIKLHSDWDSKIPVASVSNKLDGSLMILSTYHGQLHAFSSGSTEGPYIDLFTSIVHDSLTDKQLTDLTEYLKNKTLLFEYINSNIDPHVIRYDFVGFRLHGAVDNKTFKETNDKKSLTQIADRFGFDMVDFYDNLKTKQQILNYINHASNKEGVVVTLQNGIKYKVKTQSYFENFAKMGTLYSNVVTRNIRRAILKNIIMGTIDDLTPYTRPVVQAEINRITLMRMDYEKSLIPMANKLASLSKDVSNQYQLWNAVNEVVDNSDVYRKYPEFKRFSMSVYRANKHFDTKLFVQTMLDNEQKIMLDYLNR